MHILWTIIDINSSYTDRGEFINEDDQIEAYRVCIYNISFKVQSIIDAIMDPIDGNGEKLWMLFSQNHPKKYSPFLQLVSQIYHIRAQ